MSEIEINAILVKQAEQARVHMDDACRLAGTVAVLQDLLAKANKKIEELQKNTT